MSKNEFKIIQKVIMEDNRYICQLPTTNPAFDDEAYAFNASRDADLIEILQIMLLEEKQN